MGAFDYVLRIALCIVAYFLGSINFAKIFAKIKKVDITKQGSGNPGAMNVMRTVGKSWGVITFVFDALKGAIMAIVGLLVLKDLTWLYILGLIAVLGHMFPLYSQLKGGKGVATAMGVFLVASPIVALIVLIALLIMLYVFKYGFIGSIIAITVIAIYTTIKYTVITKYMLYDTQLVGVLVLCWTLWGVVVAKHYSNFKRLISGQENTLQLGKKKDIDSNDKIEDNKKQ